MGGNKQDDLRHAFSVTDGFPPLSSCYTLTRGGDPITAEGSCFLFHWFLGQEVTSSGSRSQRSMEGRKDWQVLGLWEDVAIHASVGNSDCLVHLTSMSFDSGRKLQYKVDLKNKDLNPGRTQMRESSFFY